MILLDFLKELICETETPRIVIHDKNKSFDASPVYNYSI